MQGRGRTPKEPVAVPMELLTIRRGQKRRGLLIGDQQATLVRRAAQRPDDKQADIGAWVGKSTTMMARTEKDFGLKVDKQPAKVQGRLLPAPVIQYGSPQHYYAGTTGAWNMKDVRHPPPRPFAALWWLCVERGGAYATRRCCDRCGCRVALEFVLWVGGGSPPHGICGPLRPWRSTVLNLTPLSAAAVVQAGVLVLWAASGAAPDSSRHAHVVAQFMSSSMSCQNPAQHCLGRFVGRGIHTRLAGWSRCRERLLSACVQFKMLAPVTIKCWAVFVLRDMRDLGGGAPGSLNNFIKMTVQVR